MPVSRTLLDATTFVRDTGIPILGINTGRPGNLANGFQSSGYQRGDSQTNDWYAFAGVNLTYRFGHKPNACYFDKVNRKQGKKRQRKAKKRGSTSSKVAN